MRKFSTFVAFLCVAALAAPAIAADNSITGWVQGHGKVRPQTTTAKRLPPASRKSSAGKASPNAQTVYTVRATFDAAAPGLASEDYEDGNVPTGGVSGCVSPMTPTSSDPPCIDPGDIAAGLNVAAVNIVGANGLAMAGAGFSGNPTKTVVSNYFTDNTDYLLVNTPTPFAFGIDLQAFFTGVTLTITLFNGATLIGTYTSPSSNAGVFWGITDDTNPCTRVNVTDPSGANAEGGDNLEFGVLIPVELQSFEVE
ncbi:MAG: hypothetical protein U0166_13055 [Acidobacteriota bacterium]